MGCEVVKGIWNPTEMAQAEQPDNPFPESCHDLGKIAVPDLGVILAEGDINLWRKDGTWERINAALRREVRVAEGRELEPSAAILDSQSVKTTEPPGIRGYDAGKKVNGRKRHILVDTLGLLLMVVCMRPTSKTVTVPGWSWRKPRGASRVCV